MAKGLKVSEMGKIEGDGGRGGMGEDSKTTTGGEPSRDQLKGHREEKHRKYRFSIFPSTKSAALPRSGSIFPSRRREVPKGQCYLGGEYKICKQVFREKREKPKAMGR